MCLEIRSQTASLNWFCWCFLCYQFQTFWYTSAFAVLGTSGCVHVPTSEDTGLLGVPAWSSSHTEHLNPEGQVTPLQSFYADCCEYRQYWSGTEWQRRVMQMNWSQWTHQNFQEKAIVSTVNMYHLRPLHCPVVPSTVWRPKTDFSATLKLGYRK